MSNCSVWPIDRTLSRCFHSKPEWTWEWWQWRGTPHSLKLQHYWSLTIRIFSVTTRTLNRGVLLPCRDTVGVFYNHSRLGYIEFAIQKSSINFDVKLSIQIMPPSIESKWSNIKLKSVTIYSWVCVYTYTHLYVIYIYIYIHIYLSIYIYIYIYLSMHWDQNQVS